MSQTHVLSIGNSDNKLSQRDWSDFCVEVNNLIRSYAPEIHFVGYTEPSSPWQSATFVFVPWPGDETLLQTRVGQVLARYGQDSAALVVGETEFITPTGKMKEMK